MTGGGIKPGIAYGETDEWGHHAVKEVVTHNDYHATLLRLFGFDYEKLTYKRNDQELSLTAKQPVRVVGDLFA